MASVDTVFSTPAAIRAGRGISGRAGRYLKGKCHRAFLVTDPGIAALKLFDPLVRSLMAEGIAVTVYDKVISDPPMTQAMEVIELVRQDKPDLVIGFGGGSSMDTAKIAAVMYNNIADLRDLVGVNLVPNPGLPTLFVPTTAGTGSEVTGISVLNDVERQVKLGIVSEHMFARMVLMDPELTLTLPPRMTVWTGLDALIHAIESYVSRAATPITEPLALRAIELVARHLRKAYAWGGDLEAREGMQTASLLAGLAFSNTQAGGAHACALALGSRYHLAHGLATTLMLPATMEFNLIAAPEKYCRIAEIFGFETAGLSPLEGAGLAVEAVVELAKSMDFAFGIEHFGASADHIPELAALSVPPARLWNSNPRPVNLEQVTRIIERSFGDWPKD